MLHKENEHTEYKRELTDSIKKAVLEDNISLNQELTFEKTTAVFKARQLKFAAEQQFSLGLRRNDGIFTNLGLLLSDQCPFTIHLRKGQPTITERTGIGICQS